MSVRAFDIPERQLNPPEDGIEVPEGLKRFDDLPDRYVHARFMDAVDRLTEELMCDVDFRQQLFSLYRWGRLTSEVLDRAAAECVSNEDSKQDWIHLFGDEPWI